MDANNKIVPLTIVTCKTKKTDTLKRVFWTSCKRTNKIDFFDALNKMREIKEATRERFNNSKTTYGQYRDLKKIVK